MNEPADFGKYWWDRNMRRFCREYCAGLTVDETMSEIKRWDGKEVFPNVWIMVHPDGGVGFFGGRKEVKQCEN